jgi:hypothetical protein
MIGAGFLSFAFEFALEFAFEFDLLGFFEAAVDVVFLGGGLQLADKVAMDVAFSQWTLLHCA